MEIGNWKYLDNSTDDNDEFKIISEPERQNPATLFKYFALNCNSLDALENSYLYAPDRWQLNDPFDCHQNLIDFSQLTESEKNTLMKHYEDIDPSRSTTKLYYHFYNFYGLISMTDCPTNTLMWAHYTSNSGFAIEYDYEKFDKQFFHGPFPINYQENFTPVSIRDGKGKEVFLYHTNVKHDIWKYESEWRFITCKKIDGGMHLPGIGENQKVKANRIFSCKNSFISITLAHGFFDMRNELIPLPEINEVHLVLTDKKLRVIDFALTNKLEIYWILNPDYLHDKTYNLRRKKMVLEKMDNNKFKIVNHQEFWNWFSP